MELFYALALLACPVGMGAMMWIMMRGSKSTATVGPESTSSADELTRLRAEVDQLRAGQQRGETGTYSTGAGSVDRG